MEELKRRGMSRTISPESWTILSGACSDIRTLSERTLIAPRHELLDESLLLLDGLVGRQIPRRDSQRQHLVAIGVPGDFVDLHAFPLKRLDHHVTTFTTCRFAVFTHERLSELLDRHTELGRVLWSMTLVDASIHRHWAFRNGSMRALGRVANFLCEMHTRLRAAGLGTESAVDLPLYQEDIGDACGMTNVHVSRVLRQLREAGCCRFTRGRLTIEDGDELRRIALFDPRYLYLPE